MNKYTVLLIDDSLLIGEKIKDMLAELPMVTLTGQAVNHDQGLEMIQQSRPDAVLLDIHLPGKSGMELLGRIKADFEGIQVIILTNYADGHYRQICMQRGADYFLDKSTEFEMVEQVLKHLILSKLINQ